MLALAITLSVIILIALLRLGVIIEYNEAGFQVWVRIGFIKRLVAGEGVKKKAGKKQKEKKSSLNIKPGTLSVFTEMIKAVLNALKRLKRKLLIKELTLYYTSAGEDPAYTALQFGAANAVYGTIIPGLKRNFRIKRIDLKAWFDFFEKEQKIYAKIAVSIAVWEIIYVICALFPIISSIFKAQKGKEVKGPQNNVRKDGQENGKSPDQRVDGNNDAKNEGND